MFVEPQQREYNSLLYLIVCSMFIDLFEHLTINIKFQNIAPWVETDVLKHAWFHSTSTQMLAQSISTQTAKSIVLAY